MNLRIFTITCQVALSDNMELTAPVRKEMAEALNEHITIAVVNELQNVLPSATVQGAKTFTHELCVNLNPAMIGIEQREVSPGEP